MNNKVGVRMGGWTAKEDALLKQCIQTYGEGNWYLIPNRAGLNRCRKSCRLRWLNYLKPGINRREFQEDEVDLIIRLHKLFGNKWSLIAGRLPGRTSNNIKNYWNSHIAKKVPKDATKPISQGNYENSAKVNAINKPIAGRLTKGMQFGMNVVVDDTTCHPQPPQHNWWEKLMGDDNKGGHCTTVDHPPPPQENWWDKLIDEDNYYDFDGGCSASECHCTTADHPPPPQENWWDMLMDGDNNYSGFDGGCSSTGGHCTTADHPPPPQENWWDMSISDDNYYGFDGGCSASGGHCTTAANGYDLQIGSPWATAGGGFTDNTNELYIDDIFQI